MNRIHILILPSWYKTPHKPIVGTFFEEQARMFIKKGCQVGVLFADINMLFSSRWKQLSEKQPIDFDDNGLPTYYSFCKSIMPRNRKMNYWYVAFKAEQKFKEYIKKHGKPDILHAHSVFNGGIVASYLSKKYNIPFVLTEHYSGLIISNKDKINENVQQIRKVFNNSSINIVVSNYFKNKLVSKYDLINDKIKVVYNVLNPIFNYSICNDKQIPFKWVVNAFLNGNKNHHLLFKSFQIVNRYYPCFLNVIGDGILRDELETLAISLKIREKIIFHGIIGRYEVKQILDESHALVSTSQFETFGVNIIEALACGRPVVATDSGGPRDIIESFNGILVSEHTPLALSKAMIELIENYESYDQKLIFEKCEEKFSEKVISQKLMNLYKQILE